MCSSVQFRYTASIALNNVGASLLARRCYNEALEAFTDAITIMHEASICESRLSNDDINAALEKSYHDLSYCGFGSCLKFQKNNCFVRMRFITENDFADTVKDGFVESDEYDHLALNIVRIELSETTICDGMAYFRGTERSILLNNLAAAYLCVATTSEIYSSTARYLSLAYQMLQLACSNLEAVCQYNCIDGDELRVRILPFTLLILQTLDRLAPALQIPFDAFEHYTIVFLDVLEEFLATDDMYASCLRATAAAA